MLEAVSAALVQARIKGSDAYTWYRYAGPDRMAKSKRGTKMKMTKGTIFGVRPSSSDDQMRIVFADLGNNYVFSMTPRVAKNLVAKSKPVRTVAKSVVKKATKGVPSKRSKSVVEKVPKAVPSREEPFYDPVQDADDWSAAAGARQRAEDKKIASDVNIFKARSTRSQALLKQLAAHDWFRVREAVALNENTPVDTLMSLSKDKHAYVRNGVARNASTPIEIVKKLRKDRDEMVRLSALDSIAIRE